MRQQNCERKSLGLPQDPNTKICRKTPPISFYTHALRKTHQMGHETACCEGAMEDARTNPSEIMQQGKGQKFNVTYDLHWLGEGETKTNQAIPGYMMLFGHEATAAAGPSYHIYWSTQDFGFLTGIFVKERGHGRVRSIECFMRFFFYFGRTKKNQENFNKICLPQKHGPLNMNRFPIRMK